MRLPNTPWWRWVCGQVPHITSHLKQSRTCVYIPGVFNVIFSSFHRRVQKLFSRQVKLPFLHIQPDICESRCSPIRVDHSAGARSELTPAEHIVAISLAWCVISVLSCCWGCCPVQRGDTCMREGVVVTCHHASVIVPGVSMAPSGPLSLRLAGNSWLPWRDVWYMLVWSPVLGTA